jgi:hypothetical protein
MLFVRLLAMLCVIEGCVVLQEMGGSLEVVHLGRHHVTTQPGEGLMRLHYDPFPLPLTRPQYLLVPTILVIVEYCLAPRILWCLCLYLM